MRGFMPSEVARLVLGYLKETKCEKTVGIFLNESPHLSEYVECLLNGREYPTCINGYSLSDILNDYQPQYRQQQIQSSGETRRETASLAMCTRDLLLSARNQHKPKLVTVSCGGDEGIAMKQSSCQTSPTRINYQTSVNLNRTEEHSANDRTPVKRSGVFPFTTPSRAVDLYSSPSSLVKSVLFNLQDSQVTPVKSSHCEANGSLDRINTPRRKDSFPRKRLYSPGTSAAISPTAMRNRFHDNHESESSCFSSPTIDAENAVSTTASLIEKTLIENLLQNPALQEVIVANINDEIPDATISIPESEYEQLSETITNIVNRTEADPAFESFFKSIFPDMNDGNVTETPVNTSAADLKSDDKMGSENTVGVRANDSCNSTTATSISATTSTDNNVIYLLPNCNNASLVQVVIGGVSSSNELKGNQAPIKSTIESSKNERQLNSLSPIKVLRTSTSAIGTQDQYEKSKFIRKRKGNPNEFLKQNLNKHHCAVKSLNFQNTNVSIIDHSKLRPASHMDLPVGHRLMSLIKTVETQAKKAEEQVTHSKNKSNNVSEVRKGNPSKLQPKIGGKINKTTQNMESANKTPEIAKSEAVLNNVNIDNILSKMNHIGFHN